jgi:hypothetical protein
VVPGGPRAGQGRQDAGRRRARLLRASTTPGKVRLTQAGLVVLCLGWGALAAVMVGQHASAANADLKAVTAANHSPAISGSLSTLSADPPVYTGYVRDGQVLAAAMAAGCVWGLSHRLAEYR